jgi:hypothetical protein
MPPSQMLDMLIVLFQEQHNVTFPFYFQYSPPPTSWWLFYCAHNSNYICPSCLISPHLILVPGLRVLFSYRKVILLQVSSPMRQATVVLHNEQCGWLLSFAHSRRKSCSLSPPVISSPSSNRCFLSFLICLTLPDSQPSVAPLFCVHVSLLSDVSFGQSALKDKTTALSSNIKNQVPNDAASFPRRMVISWWHVLPRYTI